MTERWGCPYCQHSEAVAEDAAEHLATLRAWAAHIRDAHGEAALKEVLLAMVTECVGDMEREGRVIRDPFNGNAYLVEKKPPGR